MLTEECIEPDKKITCIRCGVCCFTEICEYGNEIEESGICEYLNIGIHETSCQLIIDNKIDKEVGLDYGCILQHFPNSYNFHRNMMYLQIEVLCQES